MTRRIPVLNRPLKKPQHFFLNFFYNLIFFIFSLLYLPSFFFKGKHKGGFWERFGLVPDPIRKDLRGQRTVWIHAVSVGEIVQAIRFANVLRQDWPGRRIVFTTTTAMGKETALKIKNKQDTVLFFPIDFSFAIRRFLNAVNPEIAIIFETEIWPNLVWELERRGIPVWIVNGRISDRALKSYRRIKYFLKRLFPSFTGILTQDETMRARFLELGALSDKVSSAGNTKFDWQPSGAFRDRARAFKEGLGPGARLWIAGSTHEGEEEILFDAYGSLKAEYHGLNLLIAPRHLDRLERIKKKACDIGLDGICFLEEMGALGDYYEIADLVFVGGSLVPVGGHNLVEPAFFGKPIVVGPYMQNFAEMTAIFKRQKALLQAENAADFVEKVKGLVQHPEGAAELGRAAKNLISVHQGATQRIASMLSTMRAV